MPAPVPSPQPPDPGDKLPTGEHLALNTEVKRWGIIPAVVAGLSAVLGTGGIIAFLVGYAGSVRAEAKDVAKGEVTVIAQRLDVIKGDVESVKTRVEAIDAGVSKDIRRLEQKIDDNAKEQRAMMGELLREVKKR